MRIIVADDQAKVRSALRLALEQEPGIEILGEAVDSTGLLDWVKAVCPDLVLFDWELPGLPPTALLPLLHYYCPDLKMVALSSQPQTRPTALAAGADDFVSKVDPPEQLLAALQTCTGKNGTDAAQL
ncbi:MAG: response regulator [Anaerolineae bacterium]|jgi:SARP family transcriptional regulator, regulator of embCAB operon